MNLVAAVGTFARSCRKGEALDHRCASLVPAFDIRGWGDVQTDYAGGTGTGHTDLVEGTRRRTGAGKT